MDKFYSHDLFLSSTILMLMFLLSPSTATFVPVSELIKDICTETEKSMSSCGNRFRTVAKFDACVGALQQDTRVNSSTNLSTLAQVAIEMAISSTKKTRVLIQNELKKSSLQCLQTCSSAYKAISGHFKRANSEFCRLKLRASSFDTMSTVKSLAECAIAVETSKIRTIGQITVGNQYARLYVEIIELLLKRLQLYYIGGNPTKVKEHLIN